MQEATNGKGERPYPFGQNLVEPFKGVGVASKTMGEPFEGSKGEKLTRSGIDKIGLATRVGGQIKTSNTSLEGHCQFF